MKKLLGIFVALAMVFTLVGTAAAADWSMYGSARIATFWIDDDNGQGSEDEDLQWDIQGNSRIGSRVKAGDVKGQFEFGVNTATVTSRIIWGEWDFGAGKLGVGQHYVPVTSFISGQAFDGDIGLLNTGAAYGGRRPMIRLEFGGFQFAAVNVHAEGDPGFGGDVDVTLPKFEAAYSYSGDMFYAKAWAGYQTFNIENILIPGGSIDVDVNSFIFGAHAGVNMGPFGAVITGFWGQNLGGNGYGLLLASNGGPRVNAAGNDVNDNDTWGAAAAISYKATDKIRLEIGYGLVQSELDEQVAGVTDNEDDAQQYYLQCLFTLAKGVYFLPEIGKLDRKDNFAGADQGDVFYAGAKWQIDF